MSPFFESRGTQRVKRGNQAASELFPNSAAKRQSGTSHKLHRRRGSSRDASSENRPCRRLCSSLAATVCVIVVFGYAGMALSRTLSKHAGRGRSGSYSEESRLLRGEVAKLEAYLLWKKAYLGIGPDTPLVGGLINKDPARPAGGGRLVPAHRSHAYPESVDTRHDIISVNEQNSGSPQQLPVTRKGVAGEPMFGIDPVRESLELQDCLIREPVPLIVGGTDGSGTRSVVALLQRLKVPMVVEDGGTMDVHGSPYMIKGGWPAVVRPVLDWTHGALYDPRDAPEKLRSSTITALGNLRRKMESSSGKLRKTDGSGAKHVIWGFKAPVSMILVPFFAEAWGKAKFLHVVRDGRDIAFSGNQTPVEKFYGETFPEGSRAREQTEGPLKAITMWNSWNVGLYEWAASREAYGATGLDYLLLHTEDLIDPAAKFAAIKDVAEFVGSPLSDKDLCCIATEASKDMGSHTTGRKERGKVTSRFGKWKGKVEGNPELSKRLHEGGERGLQLFGYKPERSVRASDGYQCPEEHDSSCPKFSTASGRQPVPRPMDVVRKNTKVPERIEDTATCVGLDGDVDFKGFDLLVGNTEEHLECCQECLKAHSCTHFTFDYKNGNCYLKSAKGEVSPKKGLVSGSVLVSP